MAAALQINFALWGMLICASLELAQTIESFYEDVTAAGSQATRGANLDTRDDDHGNDSVLPWPPPDSYRQRG